MQNSLSAEGLYINDFHRENSMAAQRAVKQMSLHPSSRIRYQLLTIGLWLLATGLSARPQLYDLNIRVVLAPNGDAHITEIRQMRIDSGGTECFIGFANMGESRIKNLTVCDETGLQYENIGKWDVDGSRSEKEGKCGIVNKPNGYELCWGLGNSGKRTYVTNYTITGLVRAYPEADAIRHVFLDEGVTPKPKHARLTIVAEDASIHLTAEHCGIWGFRYKGSIKFIGDSIVAETIEPMDGSSGLYIMVRFDKGMFQPSIQENVSFWDKQEEAFKGSDYEKSFFRDFFSGMSLSDIISLFFILLMFVLIGIVFIYQIITVWRFRRLVNKDLVWYRDIPMKGNLTEANNVINAYRYVGSDYKNLLSAIILKLVNLGAISIETRRNRMEQSFVIHDLENKDKQPVLVSMMHNIFKMAAGDDTVLDPNELTTFMESSVNSSIVESFIKTLNVIPDDNNYIKRIDEARQVFGLMKFLKEFTLLDERHVSEVSLWKDYMIYATLFGIADQVIKDMKKINPEYFNMDKVAQQMANNISLPIISDTLSNSTAQAIADKAEREARQSGEGGSSSWGGGGGGFSGGGGGGGVR